MHFNPQRGFAFIMVLIFILALGLAGASFMVISSSEIIMTRMQNDSTKAFYLANAGIESGLYALLQDFNSGGGSPSWRDGDIDGIACGPNSASFYTLYGSTNLGEGSYTISLKNTANNDEIFVRATGTCGDNSRSIEVYVKAYNVSPWNNAIFGGAGTGGMLINGNVSIAGSVHILGTGIADTDFAMNMSGSAGIQNNYDGIPASLSSRIPACPTVDFGGENIQSLGATLRVKNGIVGLSGTADAGGTDVPGNSYKETLDGVYVTDGYGGNKGAANVYSDNGSSNPYDLGDSISFPSLNDSYTEPGGPTYTTYKDYLKANALVISNAAQLAALGSLTPTSNFSYTDGANSISMNGSGAMTISGIVYIQGGDLGMNKSGSNKTITYTGIGSILVEGDADASDGATQVNVNLLTSNTFPTSSALGVMSVGKITFDAANIDVIGAFYSQERINVAKQTNVGGTLVSNLIDMGSNVPSVYQVPALYTNLPPGMIGAGNSWIVVTSDWQEI
ncbi:MAG: hypothetical protein COS99_01715 [Candidatus Omnitrophica bacterium CG07_land_8_20_14_0_80_42_15]|uniref:Type 4 fimbrial biogenesis protein PilX N-terminal domain-containing protein n=1 Tax=Candidatus Aquitaenariimonas noxiae TaxID=1974741 RepID=A0A2J0KUJ6_9BACT|nr:MAG: hypothetical protein COS99_01715 [Candidatus Omnitrophica bacterium CG07_land_8_20_14_0_80_42_15]